MDNWSRWRGVTPPHLHSREAVTVNVQATFGENNAGEDVDLYVPRKCSATSKVLNPRDRSSVQLNFPKVDASGRIINDEYDTMLAISGYVRNKGKSDLEIEKILRARGLYPVSD